MLFILVMQLIASYMQRHNLTQAAFGAKVGASQGMVWQWLNKYRPVSPEAAVRIERGTNGEISRYQLRPDIFGKRAA